MYNQFPYSRFSNSPYNSFTPHSNGVLGSLGKKPFNWDNFLNNAQRTLNVINQAMPIYNQVKPMFRNMGTIFRVIGELNSAPSIATTTSSVASGSPTFFA